MRKRASRRGPTKVAKDPAAPSASAAAAGLVRAPRRWPAAGPLGLLLAVTVVCYLPSLDGGMLFDDASNIEQNLPLKDLGRFVRHDFWAGLGRGSRVMADLTFALNYAQGRLDPRPYHVTSILCHLLAAVVVFLLGRRLLERLRWPRPEGLALAATALWALHPLNSQAVSYIVQRAEVLASIGYAGAVLLVLEAARRGRTPAGVACYAGALVAALLGFESKPILVSLPAAVLAALWVADLPGGRASGSRTWLQRAGLALPFGLAALRYGTSTVAASAGTRDMGFDIPALQAVSYPATQARVVLAYLRQLLWPDGLSLDHEVEASRSWLEPAVLGSSAVLLLLVGGVSALAWRTTRADLDAPLARASRLAAFGLAWWFILLSPTSSLVPLADLMMDHRPYLASWGLLLGGVTLVAALLERWLGQGPRSRRAGLASVLTLSTALAVGLHERNKDWAGPEATWTDVVRKAPSYWRGWQNLAQAFWQRKAYQPAIEASRRALEVARLPEERMATLRNTGACLLESGDLDQGLDHLLQAERLGLDDASLQANLATALGRKGRFDEAVVHARRSVAIAPGSSFSHATLGQILYGRGDHAGALEQFQRAVELDPDSLPATQNLAAARESLDRPVEACAAWRRYGEIRGGAARAAAERQRLQCARLEAGAR